MPTNKIETYLKKIIKRKVDEIVKTYEREVLSVSAGKTYDVIHEYCIHACPNTSNYNYKKPLFITFRKSHGGMMERLYKIEDEIVLDPHSPHVEDEIKNSNYKFQRRLINYIKDRKKEWKFEVQEKFKFYILSEIGQIELKHCPKPKGGNGPGPRYYSLSELLSGKKEVVVESNKSSS